MSKWRRAYKLRLKRHGVWLAKQRAIRRGLAFAQAACGIAAALANIQAIRAVSRPNTDDSTSIDVFLIKKRVAIAQTVLNAVNAAAESLANAK